MKMGKSYNLMTAELEDLKDTAFNLTIAEYYIEVSLSFPYYLSFFADKLRYTNKETIQKMIEILERKIPNGKFVLEVGKDFLSGVKYGYGKSFFKFNKYEFSYDIITEKAFILFLKRLEKEVLKNESENK
jgi:hypothetical protein